MVAAAPDDEEPTGEAWRIMDLAEGLACERFPASPPSQDASGDGQTWRLWALGAFAVGRRIYD